MASFNPGALGRPLFMLENAINGKKCIAEQYQSILATQRQCGLVLPSAQHIESQHAGRRIQSRPDLGRLRRLRGFKDPGILYGCISLPKQMSDCRVAATWAPRNLRSRGDRRLVP